MPSPCGSLPQRAGHAIDRPLARMRDPVAGDMHDPRPPERRPARGAAACPDRAVPRPTPGVSPLSPYRPTATQSTTTVVVNPVAGKTLHPAVPDQHRTSRIDLHSGPRSARTAPVGTSRRSAAFVRGRQRLSPDMRPCFRSDRQSGRPVRAPLHRARGAGDASSGCGAPSRRERPASLRSPAPPGGGRPPMAADHPDRHAPRRLRLPAASPRHPLLKQGVQHDLELHAHRPAERRPHWARCTPAMGEIPLPECSAPAGQSET